MTQGNRTIQDGRARLTYRSRYRASQTPDTGEASQNKRESDGKTLGEQRQVNRHCRQRIVRRPTFPSHSRLILVPKVFTHNCPLQKRQ